MTSTATGRYGEDDPDDRYVRGKTDGGPWVVNALVSPLRHLTSLELTSTFVVHVVGVAQFAWCAWDMTTPPAASFGGERRIPAALYVVYDAVVLASVLLYKLRLGASIGLCACLRLWLVVCWLVWQGVTEISILPLASSDSASSAGPAAVEAGAVAVLLLAVLQDAHVLFDHIAGVTSNVMHVPIGYEQCELCGELSLKSNHTVVRRGDGGTDKESKTLLSPSRFRIKHNCAALRRAVTDAPHSQSQRKAASSSYRSATRHDHSTHVQGGVFPCVDDASFSSRWTFSWLNPLINFSYRNTPADVFADDEVAAVMIPSLPAALHSLQCAVLPAVRIWRRYRMVSDDDHSCKHHEEQAAVHPQGQKGSSSSGLVSRIGSAIWSYVAGAGSALFLRAFVDKATAEELRRSPCRSLYSLFLYSPGGQRFSKLCVILKISQDVLSSTSPIMVSYLIHFIKDVNAAGHLAASSAPHHDLSSNLNNATAVAADPTQAAVATSIVHGVGLCGLMFVVLALQTLLFQNYLRHLYLASTEATTALRGMILERLLATPPWSLQQQASGGAKGGYTEGTVVSLVTVDAPRCGECLIFFHNVWGHPMMVVISVGLLMYYVGVIAATAAAVSLIVMMPVNRVCTTRVQDAQRNAVGSGPRVSLTNEVLSNMRLIKASVWDGHLLRRLIGLRQKESDDEENSLYAESIAACATNGSSVFVCVATFTAYYAVGGALQAETLVPALAALNLLRFPMWSLPPLMSTIARGVASMRRVDAFLGEDHAAALLSYEHFSTRKAHMPKGAIECVVPTSFTFSQPSDGTNTPTLQNIVLTIRPGEKIAVQGAVGCGKSALLLAMVGELAAAAANASVTSRTPAGAAGFRVGGTIAYCGETPWLRHESVRKNICMHQPFDPEWYHSVLAACELRDDLARFPDGDNTMVGDRGVQLSGGQQARVALARAVYARHDVYLLDGVLDALDRTCRVNIFKNVVHGLLRRKTCVFVTHQSVQGGSHDDHDGLGEHRTLEVRPGGIVVGISASANMPKSEEEEHTADEGDNIGTGCTEVVAVVPPSKVMAHVLGRSGGGNGRPATQGSTKTTTRPPPTAEKRVSDSSLGSNIVKYLRVFELRLCLVIFTAILHQALQTSMDIWFGFWISRRSSSGITFLVFYALIGVATTGLSYVRAAVFFRSCLQVANILVSRALERLLGAPVSFFDAAAAGTLTTALSKDVDILDRAIPESMKLLLQSALQLIAIAMFNSFLSPMFLLVLPITVSLFLNVSLRFLAVSKEVRKLENRSIGGLASVVKEVYQGGAAVRCDKDISDSLREEFCQALDVGNRARDVAEQLDRWSGMRLELVAAILATAAAFVSVVYSAHIPPAFAGVAVVNCLTTSRILLMLCRRIGMFQMQFMSVEQVLRLQDVPQESQLSLAEAPHCVPPSAPLVFLPSEQPTGSQKESSSSRGGVILSHLSLAYRCPPTPPSKELVYSLLDVNTFADTIRPTDRVVGLAGKSGAGKSSLFNAFLGLADRVEAQRMLVHGVDFGSMSRREARLTCLIIPQTPPLLKGTWRYNLSLGTKDVMMTPLPSCNGSVSLQQEPITVTVRSTSTLDSLMWDALRRTGLDAKLDAALGLDTPLDESGSNFSAGERQLFCIARALMRRPLPPLILLDEVTARVDDVTDAKVHHLIREAFFASHDDGEEDGEEQQRKTTVFMIAHRESSLARCDVVLEFDRGTITSVRHQSGHV